jgi:hypothetical protein
MVNYKDLLAGQRTKDKKLLKVEKKKEEEK